MFLSTRRLRYKYDVISWARLDIHTAKETRPLGPLLEMDGPLIKAFTLAVVVLGERIGWKDDGGD